VTLWSGQFSDANGWNVPETYSTITYADVDGDGKADVCARGNAGITCALSTGTAFGATALWTTAFADASGGNAASSYSTIRYPDIDGDGKADICGRTAAGMMCGLSDGTKFTVTSWSTDFSDTEGFSDPSSYSTLDALVLATVCP
jgi:hypothetical protein